VRAQHGKIGSTGTPKPQKRDLGHPLIVRRLKSKWGERLRPFRWRTWLYAPYPGKKQTNHSSDPSCFHNHALSSRCRIHLSSLVTTLERVKNMGAPRVPLLSLVILCLGTLRSIASTPIVVAPVVTVRTATRLLDQATFGPTLSDVNNVQRIGITAYLQQQLAMAPTISPKIPYPPPALCSIPEFPANRASGGNRH
jgi:hypothetical protein